MILIAETPRRKIYRLKNGKLKIIHKDVIKNANKNI